MKFTIEKGLSIYDLNDAIKFFMAQHDFGELRNVTLENDIVVNVFAENYWGDEIIGEYVISREYVDKIKEKKRREYEENCREWILPELWEATVMRLLWKLPKSFLNLELNLTL